MSVRGRSGGDSVLIAALAAGATYEDAATQAGVSERTVRRRLEDAEFSGQVDATRSEMIARAVGRLAEASTEAADTLRGLLAARSETVRLGAARSILELAVRLREHDELVSRIEALEATLTTHAQKGRRSWRPTG